MAQFTEIMRLAANEVGGWGGRLVFVNLPAVLQACLGRDHPSRKAILDVPRRLGADFIDLEQPLFDLARAQGAHVITAQPSCAGHYSEAAYAVVADVLLDYLRIVAGAPLPPAWSEALWPDGGRQLIYFRPAARPRAAVAALSRQSFAWPDAASVRAQHRPAAAAPRRARPGGFGRPAAGVRRNG